MTKVCCTNSNCYTEDEVSDQDELKCSICGSQMVKATISFRNIWMSPNIPIARIKKLVNKYGVKKVIQSTKLKPEREAWVTAIWLFGLRKSTGNEYWIEIETVDATPDTHVYYLEQKDGNNHRWMLSVEIVDWEDHSEDILDIIKSKCSKLYPNHFTLLVYARKTNQTVNLEKVFQELKKIQVPFMDIWVVGAVDFDTYQIIRVFPERAKLEFSLNDSLLKNRAQGDFATFLQRGTGTEFSRLGTLYLPIPLEEL